MKVNRQKKKTATGHFPYGYCPGQFLFIKNTPLYFYALTVSTNFWNAFLPSSVHL